MHSNQFCIPETLLEISPIGTLFLDAAGTITYANPRAEEILGLKKQALSGRAYNDPVFRHTKTDGTPLSEDELPFSIVKRTKQVVKNIEYVIVRSDGSSVFISVSGAPSLSDSGKFLGMVAAIEDISARKIAEEKLQENEKKWHSVYQLMPIGVSILDTHRNIIEFNPALGKILGITEEGLRAGLYKKRRYLRPDGTLMSPEEFPSNRAVREQAVIPFVEIHIEKEDGTIIYTKASAAPLTSGACVVATVDITERRRMDAALRESEEKFHMMFSSNQAIMGLSTLKDGRYIDVNNEFLKMTGFSREEVLGNTSLRLNVWESPEKREMVISMLREHGTVNGVGMGLRTKSGEVRTLLLSVGKVVFRGEPCLLVSGIDQTAYKQTDAKLRMAHELMQSVVENTIDMVWAVDANEFGLLSYNQALSGHFLKCRALNISKGMRPKDLFTDPVNVQWWEDAYAQILRDSYGTLEYSLTAGGKTLLCSFTVLKNNNIPTAISVFAKDITQRKMAEEALRGKEEEYRSLLDNLAAGVVVHDADTSIVFSNQISARLLGLTQDQLYGKTAMDPAWRFIKEDGSALPPAEYPVSVVLSTGKTVHNMLIGILWSGQLEPNWAVCNGYPIKDASGRPRQAVITFVDITERKRVENALAKAAEKLSMAQKAAGIGIWNWDIQANKLDWTEEMYSIFGLENTQPATFEMWRKILHPEDLAIAEERIASSLHNNKPLINDYRIVWQDGTVHWVQALGNALYDSSGKAYRMTGTCQDITLRKQMEMELASTKDVLQSTIDNTPALIYVTDTQHRFTVANKAISKIIGRPISGIIGKRRTELLPPEVASAHEDNDRVVMTAGSALQFEENSPGPDNIQRSYLTVKFPLKNEAGEITGIGGVSTDITERNRSEQALKDSKDLLESVVENVPLMIFLKEAADLRFVIFNHAGEDLLGHNRKELLGKNNLDLFPPEQAAHFMTKDREVLDGEAGFLDIPEEPISTAKKGERVLHTRKIRIRGGDGTSKYLLGISEDITERKLAEKKQLELQLQLNQSQKMESVGRLAGGVAHDFNNLLTAIGGYAGFLMRGLDNDDPKRGDIQEILTATERAAGLTKQLLAFSRKQILNPQVVDLNASVAGVAKMLKRLIGENIHLKTIFARQACPAKVDSGQIDQVLINLAVNSRDAMPKGGALILETGIVRPDANFSSRHPALPHGDLVCLTIRDTGCGMTEEAKQRIFEPFFTTKEKGKGTGLGLATVFGIVKQSGGEIEVESVPDSGTTFRIYFPFVENIDKDNEKHKDNEKDKDKDTLLRGSETVLLVEDEDSLRRLGERLLKMSGYIVIVAADGKSALDAAERHGKPFDLLMTDVIMPGMSGRELAKEMASRKMAHRTLFMSGYTDDAIVEHGVLDPGVAFIYKPFTVEALSKKLREVLDGPADKAKP